MGPSFASTRLVMALFFTYSFSIANWLIRIPDVQTNLSLDPGTLAICLVGMPVGLVASMSFSGLVVERFGARNAIRFGFLLMILPIMMPGLAWDATTLFLALALLGLGMGPVEVGLNVAADRIGVSLGKTIMSRCHGFWSVGLMAGGVTGSAAATLGVGPDVNMILVAVFVLVMSQILVTRLPRLDAFAGVKASEKTPVFVLPPRNILLLCLFAFGMLLVEGAIADWSAIYLRDVFGAVPPVTGFAFTIFGFMMAAGRLAGDWLSTRYGAMTMARVCCSIGVFGLVLMAFAFTPAMVIAGAAAGGFGVSIVFPLAVTAAASRGGSAAVNVAALSLLSFTGFLIGPPLMGLVTELAGLRVAFGTLLIPAVVSLLLSGEVRVRSRTLSETEIGGARSEAA